LEFTVMSHVALGCVVGNRLADAHKDKDTIKPHLRGRLAMASSRTTTLGCVTTGRDGRLSFVPNYLMREREAVEDRAPARPRPAFQPVQRVTVSVMELLDQDVPMFELGEAHVLAGREGVVVDRSECALFGLVLVTLDGVLRAFTPAFLHRVRPGNDDVRAAMTAAGCTF
jgi:hypothetical protein